MFLYSKQLNVKRVGVACAGKMFGENPRFGRFEVSHDDIVHNMPSHTPQTSLKTVSNHALRCVLASAGANELSASRPERRNARVVGGRVDSLPLGRARAD